MVNPLLAGLSKKPKNKKIIQKPPEKPPEKPPKKTTATKKPKTRIPKNNTEIKEIKNQVGILTSMLSKVKLDFANHLSVDKQDKSNLELKFLIDEFEVVKTYLRKGNRPAQMQVIKNFEKHLRGLNEL